jgi:hypothetical protein
MTITIPYPKSKAGMKEFCKRFGLNAIYAGKHWAKRREDSEYWHNTVHATLMQQRIPRKMYDRPVTIVYYWNDNLDCSNHAYIGKMIEDALKGWVIQNDSRRYVKEIVHKFHDGDCIVIEVKPYEIA